MGMGIHHAALGPQGTLIQWGLLLVLGVVTCFVGYRLFRVVLGVWGFVAGTMIAGGLVEGAAMAPLFKLGIAVLGGIAGALLVSFLYMLGVFLFGAGFGLVVGSMIQELLHLKMAPWPLLVVLGILGGVAAVLLQGPLIKLFTAFGGAWVIVACLGALVLRCPPETFPAGCRGSAPAGLLILVGWLVVGALGFATQARLPSPPRQERRRER